ncbi:hypothetical protein EON65_01685 [archaeon]|nr:MAG: hypothetical protein EON65_01685 [archaeon]
MLDTYSLKTLLLALPNLQPIDVNTGTTSKPVPSTNSIYLKLINNKAGHIEVILKLLGTPEEMLVERFRMLWPDGTPSDLQMLMSLKGTKRNDQQVILEMLGLAAASKILNKTAGIFHGNTQAGAAQPNTPTSSTSASSAAANFAATSTAATAAAFSSMKSLTQDLSSQARNAVGNLKWGAGNK